MNSQPGKNVSPQVSARTRGWLLFLTTGVLFSGALLLNSRTLEAACEASASACLLDRRYATGETVTELLQAPSNVYNRKILAGGITDADFGVVPPVPVAGYRWAGLQYRSGDAYVASGPRAEYQDVNRPHNIDRFYRAYVHVPRDYALSNDGYSFRIVMQWHEGKGSPPFSLQIDTAAGTVKLVRKAYDPSTGKVTFPVVKSWPVSEWVGTTRLIVVQAKWLKNNDGYFRIWLDPDGSDYNAPDAAYAGATIQEGSSTQPVYWKWGTYGKPSKYFYTGIAISEAGGRAGYDAVMPSSGAPVNTAAPSVSGTLTALETVQTTAGTWTGTPVFTYQWRRCDSGGSGCVDIVGATSAAYVLSASDVGRTVRAVVVATNAAGATSATSSPTAMVAGIAPKMLTAPAIMGVPTVPQSLEASAGTWSGTPTPTHAYQWRRCDTAGGACLDITGATLASYTLADADAGKTVRVAVTVSNLAGSASATSAATAIVTSPPPVFVRRAQGIASSKADSTSLSISNVSVRSGEALIVSVLIRSTDGTIQSVRWGTQDVPVVGAVQSITGIGDTPRFATFYLASPAPRTATLVVTFTANARASAMSYEVVSGLGAIDRRSIATGSGTAVSSGLTATTSAGNQYHYGVIGCACSTDDPSVSLGGSVTMAGQRGGTLGAVPNAMLQTGYGEQKTSGTRSVTATFPISRFWVAEIISIAAR